MTALDDFVSPESGVTAVYPLNRYVPERVRQFINHLRAIYRQKGYRNRIAILLVTPRLCQVGAAGANLATFAK